MNDDHENLSYEFDETISFCKDAGGQLAHIRGACMVLPVGTEVKLDSGTWVVTGIRFAIDTSPYITLDVVSLDQWLRMNPRPRSHPASFRSSRRELASSDGCGCRAMILPFPFASAQSCKRSGRRFGSIRRSRNSSALVDFAPPDTRSIAW